MMRGIIDQTAPELRVDQWIDATGKPCSPLTLNDLGSSYKLLFCFLHWCPGCHRYGFPTLKYLIDALQIYGWGFAAIQTTFEGHEKNTFSRLRENQLQHGLAIPFGHDDRIDDSHYPTLMQDYRAGGTPWFILIDPMGKVVFNNFRINEDRWIAKAKSES